MNTQKNEEGLVIDENILSFLTVVESLPIPLLSDALGPFLTIVGEFGPDPTEKLQNSINECNERIENLANVIAVETERNELINTLSKTVTASKELEDKLDELLDLQQKKGKKISTTEIDLIVVKMKKYVDSNITNVYQYMEAYTKKGAAETYKSSPINDYIDGFNFGYQILSEQYMVFADAGRTIIYFYENNKKKCDKAAWDSYIQNNLNSKLNDAESQYNTVVSKEKREMYLHESMILIYNNSPFKLKKLNSDRYFNSGYHENAKVPYDKANSKYIFDYPYKFVITETLKISDEKTTDDRYYQFRLSLTKSGKWDFKPYPVSSHKIKVPTLNFKIQGKTDFFASTYDFYNDGKVTEKTIPWLVESWDVNYNAGEGTIQFQSTLEDGQIRTLTNHKGYISFTKSESESHFRVLPLSYKG